MVIKINVELNKSHVTIKWQGLSR